MVSHCNNAFLLLRAMQKYLELVDMLSPVLLGHKKKGGIVIIFLLFCVFDLAKFQNNPINR